MSYLVVGIENRTSKSGKSYHMLHLSCPFIDPKYGVGSRTSVEYVSQDNYPDKLAVGDTVELSFGRGFDGKAFVNAVHVVGDIPPVQIKK